ncbi:MAG: hypothetical protein FJW94_10255 [Actinobacteria bacterium]|nr:hypothetical protein [Actinomycetota bacterium]
MEPTVQDDPQRSLERIRSELWDPTVCLERVAPGVTPHLDLSSLGLHSVRESALGAYADLGRGELDRAVATLRAVLTHQYDAPGRPWDGTFRVTAEQADPPGADAVEWLHYDPNWRQFLGAILAVTVLDHRAVLPADVVDGVSAAVVRCAIGEPEERIPEWYTNPNLLHAWVDAHAGLFTGDDTLVERGRRRAQQTIDRFEHASDVDEYNSPTYDGVDLLAAALWVVHPPTPHFAAWGRSLLDGLCDRISTLVDTQLACVCGPYWRAYGIALDRYVSLLGLWLHVAGVERVLPAAVDPGTDHVHDLWFLPLVTRLASSVTPPWQLRPVDSERRYVQRFDDVVAISILRPGRNVGWATGPVPEFAADQYVPFVAHCVRRDGTVAHLGVRPGEDVELVDAGEVTRDAFRVRLKSSGRPVTVGIDGVELQVEANRLVDRDGVVVVESASAKTSRWTPMPSGWSLHAADPELLITLTPHA